MADGVCGSQSIASAKPRHSTWGSRGVTPADWSSTQPWLADQRRVGGTQKQEAAVLFSVAINEAAQRGKYGGHALRLIEDQAAGVEPPFQLKRRFLGEQVPQRRVFKVA